jgi:glycosyltransferase involved in cell wall biosynthesis
VLDTPPVSVLHTRVVTGTGGGPDKTILLSAGSLAHTRYRVSAAYFHPPHDSGFGVLRRRAEALACPLASVPDRGPLDLSVVWSMLQLCRRLRVQVWHAHDYKSNLVGLVVRRFHPMRMVTTVHGWVTFSSRTPLYYAIDRVCLRWYEHVICVSADLAERVRALGVTSARMTLLRNAVDTRMFRRDRPPAEAALRRSLGVPPGRFVLGAIGRLSPEKGFADLVRAVARLVAEGTNLELWIAGDGPQRGALAALVDALALRDRVRLLGFCEQPIELYEALDGLVLSSVREGLPNVLLEAMAMQVPVVATRVPGIAGLVDDGRTGLLAPIAEIEGLTAAVRKLVCDGALRGRLASAAQARVEERFDLARRMDGERAVYDELLAPSGRC